MLLNKKFNLIAVISVLLFISSSVYSQHRGDDIYFQGLSFVNNTNVKSTAMGAATVSLSGDLFSVFNNPAGLIGIENFQISVNGSYYTRRWMENQEYRPNRYFVTLPFYLEGLYVPDPADDGLFDHDRLWTASQQIDSTYIVNSPKLGLDKYSEEAAEWIEDRDDIGFNNVAVAFPFNLSEHKFVVSAAYNRTSLIDDFDRNDTFLDPHLGYFEYGESPRVDGKDSIDVNWYSYLRNRVGIMDNITAAVGYEVSDLIKVGFGFNYSFGDAEDQLYLTQVGKFRLVDENQFRFWYSDNDYSKKGTSEFSSTKINFGAQLTLENFSFGVNIYLPYTITRDWSFNETTALEDTAGVLNISTNSLSGTDEIRIPATFNVGMSFRPIDNFLLALEYDFEPFSKAELDYSNNDLPIKNWADRNTLKFGIQYQPYDFLTLLGGYRNIPSTFIPDGAAVKDRGPDANSYTVGASIELFFGKLDLAYEYRIMKYYDSYYSNTNYVKETYSNLLFGYTFSFE